MTKCKWLSKPFLKYTGSSFVSSVAEEVVFLLMTWLLGGTLAGFALALIPMAIARLVSCVINFYINQKLVFQSSCATGSAFLRYFIHAIPVAVLQVLLTYGIYALCSIGEEQVGLRGAVYAVVMMVLFVVSFLIQKFWVFSVAKGGSSQ